LLAGTYDARVVAVSSDDDITATAQQPVVTGTYSVGGTFTVGGTWIASGSGTSSY